MISGAVRRGTRAVLEERLLGVDSVAIHAENKVCVDKLQCHVLDVLRQIAQSRLAAALSV
jgi:hypothetical protein